MTDLQIKKIIEKLPLWVKAAQLTQLNAAFVKADTAAEITGLPGNIKLNEKQVSEIGSVLNFRCGGEAREIQDLYLSKSEYKIPLIFMMDVIHGYKTIFPVPIALACTFDEKLIEKTAEISAVEAKYDGVQVTFSPMVDLSRDARWGRCMESSGEDPYLNGKFGRAMIRGYRKGGLGSCVKHFACYGAAEGGRDYNTTDISERSLREYYLRSYRDCIEEKPEMVMTSFNALNGVPLNGHRDLTVDILRKEWGFDGVVISDYAAVIEMISHGYLASEKECASVAANNEIDFEMMSASYIKYLDELVAEGKLDEKKIDEMLYRVLSLKNKYGLFENPYGELDEKKAATFDLCDEYRETARIAAEKSFVLLKNDGVLPLKKEAEIAVVGPFAREREIIGNWHCFGDINDVTDVLCGMEKYLGRSVPTANGCSADLLSEDYSEIPFAVETAARADCVIACIGEKSSDSGEGASRTKLEITAPQTELVKALKKSGKKVISVVFGGRPQVLTEIEKYSDAILYVWQPGTEGGNAVARVLYGEVNPSGKLTMSFPRTTGQCPIYYNGFSTGRPRIPDTYENCHYNSGYRDCLNSPLYPFGYGLSYTRFELSDMSLSTDKMSKNGKIVVSVKVKNIGDVRGEEVVQLYVRDLFASAVRPVKELKDYVKVSLDVGEEITVSFTVTEETLKFYNADCEYVSEAGDFEVMVGNSSDCRLKRKFSLTD